MADIEIKEVLSVILQFNEFSCYKSVSQPGQTAKGTYTKVSTRIVGAIANEKGSLQNGCNSCKSAAYSRS